MGTKKANMNAITSLNYWCACVRFQLFYLSFYIQDEESHQPVNASNVPAKNLSAVNEDRLK